MAPTPKSRPLPPELRAEEDATELEEIWGLLEAAAPSTGNQDTDAAWSRLEAALGPAAPPTPSRPPGASSTFRPRRRGWLPGAWLAAAAVAVLALGGAFLARSTVEAPLGSTALALLPDGSTVELNSGSVLSHPRWGWGSWRGSRSVNLDGEAYFDVAPGSSAFVVRTFDARTVVVGTRFNLRARSDFGGATEVVVTSGRVRVEDRGGRSAVELGAGESARVRDGAAASLPVSSLEVERALAWRSRGFSVSELPLGAVLRELERRFDVAIQVGNDVALEDTLTLHYGEPRDLRSILGDIATARGLRFRPTNGGYELF
jgi:transmembrane sensor